MDALILGIDAGTWDVVNPLMDRGELPNLTELARAGRTGTLESTLPPLTGPAWASLMLRSGPGEHPYFDFKRYNITDYQYEYNDAEFIGSSAIRGETVWDSLSTAGYRLGVVNIPMTVPAWEINGVMISGFPSPEVTTTPTDIRLDAPIEDLVVPALQDMSQAERLDYCLKLVESEEAIALELLADHDIDVLGINFMSSDIAQHYFWREHKMGDGEFTTAIERVYHRIDSAIGTLLEQAGDCPTFIFSDHGAGSAPTRFFNINSWLQSEGYLNIDLNGHSSESDTINSKAIDFHETAAYRFPLKPPAEGIVLNVEGRQPDGQVDTDDYGEVRSDIIRQLESLKDRDGTGVVERVKARDDVYTGPHSDQVPDIVMILNPTYKGAPKVTNTVFEDIPNPYPNNYTGIHRTEGIYILPFETDISGIHSITDLREMIEATLKVESKDNEKSRNNTHGTPLDSNVIEQLQSLGYTE